MILDVGCGHIWRGDVNVDLEPKSSLHRSPNQNRLDDEDLDVKSIPNFVVADASHLPFRDGVFSEYFSSHTIEHCKQPIMFFSEMVRVLMSGGKITIICPFYLTDGMGALFPFKRVNKRYHVSRFNRRWFLSASKIFRIRVLSVSYSKFVYFPHYVFTLMRLPCEITFEGNKL